MNCSSNIARQNHDRVFVIIHATIAGERRSSRNLSAVENVAGGGAPLRVCYFLQRNANELGATWEINRAVCAPKEPRSPAYESTASNPASRRSRNRLRHRIAEFLASRENCNVQSYACCGANNPVVHRIENRTFIYMLLHTHTTRWYIKKKHLNWII